MPNHPRPSTVCDHDHEKKSQIVPCSWCIADYADCAEGWLSLRRASSRPIEQLIGQVSSHDNQYQCGQPLLQLGMIEAMPITSPMMKNQSTWPPARRGATRAHSQAQKIELTTNRPVLVSRALFEGTCPFT